MSRHKGGIPGHLLTCDLCLRQGQKFLLALNVRCIQDLNEITSHMMEVVQAHMQLFGQVRLAWLKGLIITFLSCRTPAALPARPAGRATNACCKCNQRRFPWQLCNFLFIQAFDVNMNPSAGPSAAGMSSVQGQVSGYGKEYFRKPSWRRGVLGHADTVVRPLLVDRDNRAQWSKGQSDCFALPGRRGGRPAGLPVMTCHVTVLGDSLPDSCARCCTSSGRSPPVATASVSTS